MVEYSRGRVCVAPNNAKYVLLISFREDHYL